MRNLLQYPITKEEKLTALNRALKLLEKESEGIYGDVNLPALKLVIMEVEASPE